MTTLDLQIVPPGRAAPPQDGRSAVAEENDTRGADGASYARTAASRSPQRPHTETLGSPLNGRWSQKGRELPLSPPKPASGHPRAIMQHAERD